MGQINRRLDIPIYKQLYQILKESIINGSFEDGGTMYSENELQEMYGISRITVRNALKILENEGYIERSQGSSSIVTNRSRSWWNLSDITNDLKATGEELTSEIIKVEKTEPKEHIRSALNLAQSEPFVYYIERIRSIDGRKIAHTRSYIVPWINYDITNYIFDQTTTITEILTMTNNEPVTCDETLEVCIANQDTVSHLDLETVSAVFFRTRINYDRYKRPLEYVESYYHPNHTKYYIKNMLISND